jgi:hypothetical protein
MDFKSNNDEEKIKFPRCWWWTRKGDRVLGKNMRDGSRITTVCVGQNFPRCLRLVCVGGLPYEWKKKTVHKRLRDGMLLTKKLSDWGSIHGHDQWWIRLRRLDACYVCNMILSLEIERWTSIKKWWVRHLVLIKKRPHKYQIHIFLPLLAKSEGVFSINMCVRWRWMNTNSAHIAQYWWIHKKNCKLLNSQCWFTPCKLTRIYSHEN